METPKTKTSMLNEIESIEYQARNENRELTKDEKAKCDALWDEIAVIHKREMEARQAQTHYGVTFAQARAASELIFPHKPDESEFMSIMVENLRFAFMEGARFAGVKN